jgi:hypothetical protein
MALRKSRWSGALSTNNSRNHYRHGDRRRPGLTAEIIDCSRTVRLDYSSGAAKRMLAADEVPSCCEPPVDEKSRSEDCQDLYDLAPANRHLGVRLHPVRNSRRPVCVRRRNLHRSTGGGTRARPRVAGVNRAAMIPLKAATRTSNDMWTVAASERQRRARPSAPTASPRRRSVTMRIAHVFQLAKVRLTTSNCGFHRVGIAIPNS